MSKDNRGKLKYQNNPKHRSVFVFKYAPTEYGNGKTAAGVGVLVSVIIIIFHIGGTPPSLGRAYSIFSVFTSMGVLFLACAASAGALSVQPRGLGCWLGWGWVERGEEWLGADAPCDTYTASLVTVC